MYLLATFHQVALTILLAILLVLLLGYLLLYFLTFKIYKSIFNHRMDKTLLHFFTKDDFEGLEESSFNFKNNLNLNLKAFVYKKNHPSYKGVIIFASGFGCGHLQYSSEYNYYASKGYIVVSYDNSGIGESEGKSMLGFPQGIIDLSFLIREIRKDPLLSKYPKFLMGHSWGGYSVTNVTPFIEKEDNIKAIVALAAPFSSTEIIYEMLTKASKALKFTGFFLSIIEKREFGLTSKLNTLATTEAVPYPFLLVHGNEDNICDYKENFLFVKEHSHGNVEYLTVDGRAHRPNISKEASDYSLECDKKIASVAKESIEVQKEVYDALDYHKLVEFDYEVMQKIDEFLEKHLND